MDNNGFVPDNIPADLEKSWHIPRPTLARSSKSSQGSTSSNSTQSVRSGSLLLTAENLAEIQQKHQQEDSSDTNDQKTRLSIRDQNIQYYLQTAQAQQSDKDVRNVLDAVAKDATDTTSYSSQNLQYYLATSRGSGSDLPLVSPVSGKRLPPEPDSVSVASSTHFTVVNASARAPPKRSCCRRHQLTVLVLTMSTLFTVGILAAVLLLEMRAKNQLKY